MVYFQESIFWRFKLTSFQKQPISITNYNPLLITRNIGIIMIDTQNFQLL